MANLDFKQVDDMKSWVLGILIIRQQIIAKVLASGDSSRVLTIWSLDEQDGEGALVPLVAGTSPCYMSLFLGS